MRAPCVFSAFIAAAATAPLNARAACPAPYDTADCTSESSTEICEYDPFDGYDCDVAQSAAYQSETFATYDTTHTVCADDYCIFGTDGDDNYYCCETSDATPAYMYFKGGDYLDRFYLHWEDTSLDTAYYGALPFYVMVDAGEDDDYISDSDSETADFREILDCGLGDDLVYLQGAKAETHLGGGDDTVNGSPNGDLIFGEPGADSIAGNNGDDEIYVGFGADSIQGGSGNDTIDGGDQNDNIAGNAGNDALVGDGGNDNLLGGDGADIIHGGPGNDAICGDSGDDELHGGDNDDTLYDESSADYTYGDNGYDTCDSRTTEDPSPSCNAAYTPVTYPCSYPF